jgi:hypothetical protein
MERQLHLLEPTAPDWHLDEATKEIGRRGVAEAREALQRARQATAAQRRADGDQRRTAA